MMPDIALTVHQLGVDSAVAEWLTQKEKRTHSQRTLDGYRDTMQAFRQFLASGGLDLPSNPIYIARLAGLWAGQRNDTSRHKREDVSPSTYNLRLAILSSWYTFGMMESGTVSKLFNIK